MSSRNISGVVLFVLFFLLSLFQYLGISRSKDVIAEMSNQISTLNTYVWHDFAIMTKEDEIELFDSLIGQASGAKLFIYVPDGLCRACFSSLLFSLHDNNVLENEIYVLSEVDDLEIKAECLARGISFFVSSKRFDSVCDILVFRLYRGYLPIMMKYALGRERILKLFLLDDENLMYSK